MSNVNTQPRKLLSIGNSFSDDAQAYLYQMAAADGVEIKTVNLYIGGCSLEQHCHNIDTGEACYEYHLNGMGTDRMSSIEEGLMEEEWDYITIQQASYDSGVMDSYYPYTEKLLSYVREHCPKAQIWLHETWAYETDSSHGSFGVYDHDQGKMYAAIKDCNNHIKEEFALPMIPAGDLIQELRRTEAFDYKNGGISLCRDGFHLSLTYGRYAAATLWYKILFGGNVLKNNFLPEAEEEMAEDKVNIIKELARRL